jgi:uncharacterized protein with GYD domain
MAKYMCTAHFTSGSWARLVKGSEDRTAVVRSLMESLGGSLEAIYWGAHGNVSFAIVDLPDAVTAKAAAMTEFKTGAFTSVEVEELPTQDQLTDSLMLMRSAEQFFEAPGMAAV